MKFRNEAEVVFWMQVYLAALAAGKPATEVADFAVRMLRERDPDA